MKEADWLACTDPTPMLEFLRGKASDRKLRLILCGWSRLNWKQMSKQGRSAVEAAERFADELVSEADREAADHQLWLASQGRHVNRRHWLARLTLVQGMDVWPAANDTASRNPRVRNTEVLILKDIFSPFHPGAIDPSCLAWNDSTVPKLAQAIYDERAFDRLPILADALEEAGCTDADILSHCRSAGPHVRGCWVIDLLLGKR